MALSKEQILAVQDLKTEAVDVPEWGGAVLVRTMTGTDRDAFEQSLVLVDADGKRRPNLEGLKVKLLALTLVDDDGTVMFGAAEITHLGNKSAAALDRLYKVSARLNGIGAEAEEQAAKNSEAAPSGSSTSA